MLTNKNICNVLQMTLQVLQNNGGTIISVIGEEKNIKITTREDLRIAEVFMQ